MTLQPQMTLETFDKWDMDFIGSIGPPLGQKKQCTHYFTNWVETKVVKVATEEKVVEFLRENLFYKFGYPRELVTNQDTQFTSHMIKNMLSQHKIKYKKSTPYHPQANR